MDLYGRQSNGQNIYVEPLFCMTLFIYINNHETYLHINSV
jgi:hypothetical protein